MIPGVRPVLFATGLRLLSVAVLAATAIRRSPTSAAGLARPIAARAVAHIDSIAVALVLVLLLGATALDASGHRLLVVSGASMEPAIARGSLIVVRPAPAGIVAVGDVVTFEHRGATVTHRVASIDEQAGARIFRTKGDANEALDPDAVSFDGPVGLLVAQLPVAGYVVALLQYSGRPLSVALGLVIAGWALRRYRLRLLPLTARA